MNYNWGTPNGGSGVLQCPRISYYGCRRSAAVSPWSLLQPRSALMQPLASSADTVDRALTVLAVDQALDKLPSIYADVMRLVRDGFTQSEIAGRLSIPIGTVKSRMAKAAATLRAELARLRRGDDAL